MQLPSLLASLALAVPLVLPGPPPGIVAQDVGGIERGGPSAVRVWNREVVVLRAQLGSLTPEQRAELAAERILALPHSALGLPLDIAELRVDSLEGFSLSVAGRLLFTIYEEDVDPTGDATLAETVEHARVALGQVFEAREQQRSLPLIARGVGLVVGATLLVAALLWGIAYLRGASVKRMRVMTARSERLRVRNIDLRPYFGVAIERLIGLVNFVAICGVLYVWIDFSLGCFPYTEPWSHALSSYFGGLFLWVFEGIIGAVPNLVIVVIIFSITRGITRTITMIVARVERRAERAEGVAPESVRATRRLAVVILWIFAVVLAYPHLPGANSDAFKGISVLLGLMMSLGSAGLVNQVMSGFVVLYSRSVRSGEVVRIGDIEGQVTDLGLLTTRVLKPSGEVVSIPNAVAVTQPTINYSRGPGEGRAVGTVSVTIGYDVPWRQVRALLLLAAKRTEGITVDPAPRVAQSELTDWYVKYDLIVLAEDGKQRAAVLSRLHAAIQDAFNEFGVQILSPHFVAQPAAPVLVPRGQEEPEPAPRFRFAKEAPPASFDPVEKAAEERAQRAAEEAAKAERVRIRAERDAEEEKAAEAEKNRDAAQVDEEADRKSAPAG